MIKRLIPLVVIFLCAGCAQKKVSQQELAAYLQDESNGLSKKISNRSIDLEIIYRPNDLVVFQQISGENYSLGQIDSIKKDFNKYDYFILKISRDGEEITNGYASDQVEFNKVIDYLSFGIGKDVRIEVSGESIEIKDFIHTRSFGASNANTILLAFESTLIERSENFSIVFEDTFFKTGINRFDFKIDDLKSTPSLNLISSTL